MKRFAVALALTAVMSVPTAKAQDVIGGHSYNFSPGAAGTQVIFTSSTNTAGAILRTAAATAGCTGAPTFFVYAVTASASIPVFMLNTASGNATSAVLTRSLYLPAGTGITLAQTNPGCGSLAITYDFIS